MTYLIPLTVAMARFSQRETLRATLTGIGLLRQAVDAIDAARVDPDYAHIRDELIHQSDVLKEIIQEA